MLNFYRNKHPNLIIIHALNFVVCIKVSSANTLSKRRSTLYRPPKFGTDQLQMNFKDN